jgi:hypothetical protein
MAANWIRELEGEVLELGLGNGRTYDHLRELLPDRTIYVCERSVAAHPDCVPPPELLLLGDMRETLPSARASLTGRIALAHLDMGTGDFVSSKALADQLAPLILPLLRAHGVLVSEPALVLAELSTLPLPDGIDPGRYHLYRRVSLRSSP